MDAEEASPPRWPFGAELRARREAARLSVRRAANRAGISEGRWRQLENGYKSVRGKHEPVSTTPETVLKVAQSVRLDPEAALELAGFDPELYREEVRKMARGLAALIPTTPPGEITGRATPAEQIQAVPAEERTFRVPADEVPLELDPRTPLVVRIADLGLDDLYRLRDMVNGAIAVQEQDPARRKRLHAAQALREAFRKVDILKALISETRTHAEITDDPAILADIEKLEQAAERVTKYLEAIESHHPDLTEIQDVVNMITKVTSQIAEH